MYEELKQEIRDVVKPNFRQQINGQNLQDVLIDMVNNYPAVSGSIEVGDLIAKSGSWDNAADWVTNNSGSLVTSESLAPIVEDLREDIPDISGLATTESVTSLSQSVAQDFANLDIPDISGLATTESVNNLSASFDQRISNITGSGVDLSGYATTASLNAATESVKGWVEDKHYLTEHQDISGLATTASVNSLSSSLHQDIQNVEGNLSEYATTASVNSLSSSLHNELAEKASTASLAQLSESVANDFANLDIPDISGLATTSSVNSLSESVGTISASFDQRINNIVTGSGGGSGSEYWVKTAYGGVYYSSRQTGSYLDFANGTLCLNDDGMNYASGQGAVIAGTQCTANGDYSFAAGRGTYAKEYQVAVGRWSRPYTGSVEMFTVGAGNDNLCRKNALTVVYENYGPCSSSGKTYILGVGGYSGEDTSGTRDLATVINRLERGETEGLWHPSTGLQAVRQTTGSVASGDYSLAEGYQTSASGRFSHAEGRLTTASGESSHAEGDQTQAEGWAGHAEGYYTTASGNYSHAEGNRTRATATGAHAEGYCTTASVQFSHAEGTYSEALGDSSHAEGNRTIASNNNEHACGRFNATASKQIFSVGCGHSEAERKNAISIVTGSTPLSASIFMYGVAGYDGTNPQVGVNDIATTMASIVSMIPKPITLTSTPTGTSTVADLAALGLSAAEVEAAYNGLRTAIKDTTRGETYPIWLASYTNANNWKLNYGTMIVHTVGTVEGIDTYYEVDITVANGTATVSVKS